LEEEEEKTRGGKREGRGEFDLNSTMRWGKATAEEKDGED
jgi:hypothetical protein